MFSRGNDGTLMDLCCKKRYIDFQLLTKKVMFFSIFLPKNLVSSEKSSTFAPDLRLRLANLKIGENHTEKTQCWKSATYEESDEKMQKSC